MIINETTNYPFIGLPGTHLGGFGFDCDESGTMESLEDFLKMLSLDGESGAFTQLMDEITSDKILSEVKEYMKSQIDDFDPNMYEDISYAEKIELNGRYYLNFIFLTDFESYGVDKILKSHQIDYIVYGADYNDYDPFEVLLDTIENGDGLSEPLTILHNEMEIWFKNNVKLEEETPSNNSWNVPDYSLSYARYLCEHGRNYWENE